MKILKRCNADGCSEFIERHESYCKEHKGYANKQYNEWRNEEHKEYVAFYKSSKWRKLRLVALGRDSWCCRRCDEKGIITIATLVDHIVPTKVDWELRLDIDNLQAMCDECHNIKTAEDKVRYNL